MRTSRWTGILRILVCLWTLDPAWAIRWLSLLKTSSLSTTGSGIDQQAAALCETLEGLNKKQIKICQRNMEVMSSVRTGAERAVRECQFQFQNRRWNCSTFNGTKIFGKALADGTREAAFVHAISSAGVAHAVTRACSSGQLVRCGCDRTVRGVSAEGFQWSGCSDNVAFGTAFSKSFVDARDLRAARGRASPRALMNLHNNEAGRKVVAMNMRVECKCHGVSGSCELKTCWRAMPPFRLVGAILKDKFDGASEVQPQQQQGPAGTSPLGGPKRAVQLVPLNPHFKPHTDTDLVYLDASPDFCDEDSSTGSLGTRDRPCNRTSRAIDGCELLCCGRGFSTRLERVRERCHCKFHWCCYVKCDECDRDVEVNTCL